MTTPTSHNPTTRQGAALRSSGVLALLFVFLLAGCGHKPLKWDACELGMVGALVATNAVDYGQTKWALDNGYKEGNFLMRGSNAKRAIMKVGVTGAILAIAHYLPEQHWQRKLMLGIPIGLNVVIIGHNIGVVGGLRLDF